MALHLFGNNNNNAPVSWFLFANELQRVYLEGTRQDCKEPLRALSTTDLIYVHQFKFARYLFVCFLYCFPNKRTKIAMLLFLLVRSKISGLGSVLLSCRCATLVCFFICGVRASSRALSARRRPRRFSRTALPALSCSAFPSERPESSLSRERRKKTVFYDFV
jgi:hypothetical protein